MRRFTLLAMLLSGCAGAVQPDAPKPAGGCSCEKRICACTHCKGGADKCPCFALEKPK